MDMSDESDKGDKMFPNAHSIIYRNEMGEVLYWDNPSDRDEWYDPDDYLATDEWCEKHEQYDCGEDDH